MPTYQTTPYMAWTFPDQAIARNKKGVQPLKDAYLPQSPARLEGPELYGWANQAREHALQRLHTNRVKEEGMLFRRNTTDRTQAHDRPAHLSQCRINGKFMAPSYEYTQTPSGLRGGTGLLTKEGRAWAKRKLAQRVEELNAIDSGDFSRGNPNKPVDFQPRLDAIDALLQQFLDQWSSGAVSSSVVENANRLVQELYKVGAVITEASLAKYVEIVARLQVQAERMAAVDAGRYTFKEEKRTYLRAVVSALNRFQRLAEEISRVINESPAVRQQVLSEIGSRMSLGTLATLTDINAPIVPPPVYLPNLEPGAIPERPF